MSEEEHGAGQASGGDEARAKRVLTDISSRSWEHPADKAALQALRKIPVFDEVLRSLFGFLGEKPIRPGLPGQRREGVRKPVRQGPLPVQGSLPDAGPGEGVPGLRLPDPMVNAGAYGMYEPFIILNSGTLRLLSDEELAFVLGHELGHIMSDHVLYRTMTEFLIQLANMGFPIVGWLPGRSWWPFSSGTGKPNSPATVLTSLRTGSPGGHDGHAEDGRRRDRGRIESGRIHRTGRRVPEWG